MKYFYYQLQMLQPIWPKRLGAMVKQLKKLEDKLGKDHDLAVLGNILAEQPEQFVQAMAQSELGLSEHRFPNQWSAALSAGISTAIGAFVPIIPFFFIGGMAAVIASFAISLVAHFLVGALKSLITIRSWWASGLEMTWIGIIVAVVTYGLGLAFGSLG